MVSSLWNGVMGMNVHNQALNIVANNSTNTNVYGYKPDEVNFSDLLYSADGTGRGTQISSIQKNFKQGDITVTNNPYDVAIEGSGFFVMRDTTSNELFYSRAGNFQMGKDGLLKTADGAKNVLGLQPEDPIVLSSDPNVVEFNDDYVKFIASEFVNSSTSFYESINTRATDYQSSATDIGVSGAGYKSKSTLLTDIDKLIIDYREKLNAYASDAEATSSNSTTQITQLNFGSATNLLNDENDVIKLTINNVEYKQNFDTDIDTTLKKFSDQISNSEGLTSSIDLATGVLRIETLIPGQSVKVGDGVINNKAVFSYTVQEPVMGSGLGMVESSRTALRSAIESAGAEFLEIKNDLSLTNQHNLDNLDNIQLKLENMSLSENTFGIIGIEENGLVF